MANYDAIVLGVGGVGSAALFHLARRGQRVLGIDRFPPGHDRGSSHGDTRLIRQAYSNIPTTSRSSSAPSSLWHELEQLAGDRLYDQVGLVQIGPPQGEVLRGVRTRPAARAADRKPLAPRVRGSLSRLSRAKRLRSDLRIAPDICSSSAACKRMRSKPNVMAPN